MASRNSSRAGLASVARSRWLAPRDSRHGRVLFSAADALEQAIEQSVAGQDTASKDTVAPILTRLRATNEWVAPIAELAQAAGELPGKGFLVSVRLAPDAALPAVRAMMLLKRAATLGTVHASRPDVTALSAGWQGDTIVIRLETAADSVR